MRKLVCLALALMLFAATRPVGAQDNTATRTITLYSPYHKDELDRPDFRRASFFLETAAYATLYKFGDLGYGFLRAGDDWDWFKIPVSDVDRGVIKDLGPLGWSDKFTVPWLQPLAKVKPGEHRQVIIGNANPKVVDVSELSDEPSGKSKRPRTSRTRTSPDLMRAVLGHMYVVHVVDDSRDFYALLRVEALQRGDNCTISWKLIPAPQADE